MSESIHPELEQIMQDAEENVIGTRHKNLLADLTAIEEALMNDKGDPDGTSEMYFIEMTEPDCTKLAEIKAAGAKILGEEIPIEQREGMLAVILVGEGGDIYNGLSDVTSMVEATERKDVVGVMIRVGAWFVKQDKNEPLVRPSESEHKQNAVTTMLVTSQSIATVVRNLDTKEMMYEVESLEDGKWRINKLSNALTLFYHAPTSIKLTNPEIWDDLVGRVKNDDVLPSFAEVVAGISDKEEEND